MTQVLPRIVTDITEKREYDSRFSKVISEGSIPVSSTMDSKAYFIENQENKVQR